MSGLTLNRMIEAALLEGRAEAMDKIAQESGRTCAFEGCTKPAMPNSEYCKEHAERMAEKERAATGEAPGEQEKTSSARIEKLAGAVEYVVKNFGQIRQTPGRLKVAQGVADEALPHVGPGHGPNALPVAPAVDGKQATEFGQAKTQAIPKTPPRERGATPKSAPNAMGTNEEEMHPPMPEEGVMIQKGANRRVNAIQAVMLRKAAAEDSNVNITQPKSTVLPEDQPSQVARPAEVTSQEQMIASNQAAIDMTKRQAKEVPKKRMGEVLKEPAQTASTDSTLQKNLSPEATKGAKIASAREHLRKIASQGCSCEEEGLTKGECGFCKIASRIERRRAGSQSAHLGAR